MSALESAFLVVRVHDQSSRSNVPSPPTRSIAGANPMATCEPGHDAVQCAHLNRLLTLVTSSLRTVASFAANKGRVRCGQWQWMTPPAAATMTLCPSLWAARACPCMEWQVASGQLVTSYFALVLSFDTWFAPACKKDGRQPCRGDTRCPLHAVESSLWRNITSTGAEAKTQWILTTLLVDDT